MDTFDEVKEMILDTNRYLLFLGITVAILHSIFDYLALKNGFSPFHLGFVM